MAEASARGSEARGLGTIAVGWFERHLQTLVASLGRLARAPFGTALTIGVIGIALALPACLELLVTNARALSGGWQSALDLTVYLKPKLADHDAQQLTETIAARPDVASARLVTSTEGLAEFRRWSGLGAALDALKDNPLPASIVVRPRVVEGAGDSTALGGLGDALRVLPGVDQVQLDTEWVRRFTAILDALRRAVLLLALVLGIAVLLVVGNTIRLDIDTRRAEIEVTKLVGGSDGFVRRPFLYGGFWYGLGGGVVAWLLVETLVRALGGPLGRVAAAYGSQFHLSDLDAARSLILLGGGALLGWIGAFASATRHLRAIEPGAEP
ncbi:MAG TPA: permease-like cell division protein FtsX [Steroidobacteraceae bacterium]|nr:permease-like cell division protein FtsX [Steroidobacteraceae bacterium]